MDQNVSSKKVEVIHPSGSKIIAMIKKARIREIVALPALAYVTGSRVPSDSYLQRGRGY